MNGKGAGGRCGAKNRDEDSKCTRYAMPNGRCRLHGGESPRGMDAGRYKTGEHSKYSKDEVLKKIKKFRDDDDVRNLRDELSILRGILHSYIEANKNIISEKRIDTIGKLCDKVERLVSSLKIIEEGHTFTIKNVNNVLLQVVKIINNRVADPDVKNQISNDLRRMSYISVN